MNIDDLFWLSYCVYLEARGEIANGQKAVAKVILNRAGGKNIMPVVLKPMQFSSFNNNARPSISDTKTLLSVMKNVSMAFDEWSNGDNLNGCEFYYNPSLCSPSWADKMTVITTIGNHKFLKQ